jgi:hypothetical protein
MTRIQLARLVFAGGFLFLIVVALWAVVVITRMQRKQAVALAILNTLGARAGYQRDTDHIEAGDVPTVTRDDLKKVPE